MAEPDPLAAAIATLRAPVAGGERAIAGALAQLEREASRTRWRRGLSGAGALAAGLMLVLLHRGGTADTARPVRLAMQAPGAGRVAVIGDFNDWDPAANPLRRISGEWSVTLRLPPGRYRYAFVVDDARWVADPKTPAAEDDFGTPTSALTVTN